MGIGVEVDSRVLQKPGVHINCRICTKSEVYEIEGVGDQE